ncbi:bifunctional protein RfaE, domain I [Leptospira terpstrae serovar Hualin str. LT 11-33 = ATCC 700639]|uniref:Bifunctional protein RfaE, domain I n=1 Tax=Leptospira terpstrae serovar Hualin str. LT 11-33 = ATCC 700639 TaxID=1257025 RepID=N1VXN5_9LEPT|nr:D-glycero-beta-D-manno-heptose-7-phosphate kinase [Leptospira terpstrae]EMY61810.1 bifunctional protein RfaE, domain I [Leptospira terpstrae serovar Hualin str. LT 11-33 = ATCC 700639]
MKIRKTSLRKSFEDLAKIKILVIGDLILDEYLIGSVERISPEAPVPVVWVRNEKQSLGGSGNVVQNLSSIGVSGVVFGRIGLDKAGDSLEGHLVANSVAKEDLVLLKSKTLPTILKTRIIASHQQICRVDREEVVPLTKDEEKNILIQFESKLKECAAVILSDYDKGYLTPSLIQSVIALCNRENKIVTVDPQVSHFFLYKNIHIMTPNHHEAGKALGRKLTSDAEIETACREISEKLTPDAMMITRGEKGMSIYERKRDSFYHIPTVAKEVFDVTGAGDTVITTYTAFVATGMAIADAALISNVSAGIVVGKLGAATVTQKEIEEALQTLGYLEGES